jgi:peptide/nickel transport system permease protein
MLRVAIARLLFTAPSLLAASLLAFICVAWLPTPPPTRPQTRGLDPAREQFLDLPLLVNLQPLDGAARARRALAALVAGDDVDAASRELARLGGAALPHVLPAFASLEPEAQGRIARALAPVAERMGAGNVALARDPERSARYWARFWEDRGVDFRTAQVRTAVRRLLRYGSAARADELYAVDTFALPELIEAADLREGALSIAQARALAEVMSHVSGRDDRVPPEATLDDALACLSRWHAFWLVHRSDFSTFQGPSRLGALATETRYARWLERVLVKPLRTGVAPGEAHPISAFAERATVTSLLLASASLVAFVLAAVWRGALVSRVRAARRGSTLGLAFGATPFVLLAGVAHAGAGSFGEGARYALGVGVTASAMLASVATSLSLGDRGTLDGPALAARARGATMVRAGLRHRFQSAYIPELATLSSRVTFVGTTAVFACERLLSLPGVAEPTLLALRARDLGWILLVAPSFALLVALFRLVSDVALASLDHRFAERTAKGRRHS